MASKDNIITKMKEYADASGDLDVRVAIGTEGLRILVRGETQATGRSWSDLPSWQDALLDSIGQVIDASAGGGADEFTDLLDTEADYTGHALEVLRVNATEDGIEFVTSSATDEQVKVSPTDTTTGYLYEKIDPGSGLVKTSLSVGGVETLILSADFGTGSGEVTEGDDSRIGDATKIQSRDVDATLPTDGQALLWEDISSSWKPTSVSGADEKTKVTAADTTADYLDSKVTGANGILDTVINPGANESLQLAPDYGSSANTVCEGDDARLSDTRDPNAHNTSHEDAGSDELSVAGLNGVLADKQDADKLQGRDLVSTAPTDGQALVWDNANSQWEPGAAGSTSPLTTKGDIYVYDTDNQRLPVGANGQQLIADATEATGLKWEDATYPAAQSQIEILTGDILTTRAFDTTDTYIQALPDPAEPDLTFTATISGTYRVDWSFMAWTSYSASENFMFKVEFDDGINPPIVVGDDESWGHRIIGAQAYTHQTHTGTVALVAGTVYTVTAYGKRIGSTGTTLNIPYIGRRPQITVSAITGSGAGGTIVQEFSPASDFTITDSYVYPTYVDLTAAEFTIVTVANEWLQLSATAYAIVPSVAGGHGYIRWSIDGGTSYVPGVNGLGAGAGAAGSSTRQNLSHSAWIQLPAGTHTIQVQVSKLKTTDPDVYIDEDSHFWVTQHRGGLVPIQQDGVTKVTKPAALDFVGAGIYQVTEDIGGVAKIELNQALTAIGNTIEMFNSAPSGSAANLTATSFTDVPNMTEQTFVVPVAGTYKLDALFALLSAGSVGSWARTEFRLMFDESDYNGFTEQIIGGGGSSDWEVMASRHSSTTNEYPSKTMVADIYLEAGTHKVMFQYKDSGGTTAARVNADAPFVVRGTLVTGSGAGGVIVQELGLSADFTITDSYITPTYVDIPSISFTVETFEGEWVQLSAIANFVLPASIVSAHGYIRWDIDSGTSYIPSSTGLIAGKSAAASARQNLSYTGWVQLSAGTHTIKAQASKNTSGDPDVLIDENALFWVTQYRGGLIPIRENGVNKLDKPAAFDFVGDDVTVTEVGGTARINFTSQYAEKVVAIDVTATAGDFDSTTQVPEGAIITRVIARVDTLYDGSATLEVKINGSTPLTVQTTAENNPSAADTYESAPFSDVAAINAGVIRVTLGGSPTVGAAKVIVNYVMPAA